VLSKEFTARGLSFKILESISGDPIDPVSIEQSVVDSKMVLFLLSKNALRDPRFVFTVEAALPYNHIRRLCVHDATTCFFPSPSEQPQSLQNGGVFVEKAVTYLTGLSYLFPILTWIDYSDTVANEIITIFEEFKKKLESGEVIEDDHDHHSEPVEDLHTRVFLSHRRLTAQGMTGRIYEGLKGDYAVFLDSEAKFKIHVSYSFLYCFYQQQRTWK
jgi:hypothetical protein